MLNLVGQMCGRVSERGGLLFEFRRGIPLGCPLSPLLGAFFLGELDTRLEETGLFFVRYMDDVLAPTGWKLRHAVRVLNETLAALGLEKHPDKTFIGRTEMGFDFLGYRFSPKCIRLARQTWESDSQYAGPGFKSESAPEGVLPVRLGCTCGVGGAGPRLVLAAWKRPA